MHEFGDLSLVPASIAVPDDHLLAPRLVELARDYWPRMLTAAGENELALEIAKMAQDNPDLNERAAGFLMRRAISGNAGALGAIARDYEQYRARNKLARDDHHAQCIMSTFAGQMLACAARTLGPHIRDDVRAGLFKLTSEERSHARQRAVRQFQAPSQQADPHTVGSAAPGRALTRQR
jgi:hypothetical protein